MQPFCVTYTNTLRFTLAMSIPSHWYTFSLHWVVNTHAVSGGIWYLGLICITVPGYQGFEGDCWGRDHRQLLRSSIQDCAAACSNEDICAGFVYIIKISAIHDCFLKRETCATPAILYNLELSMYYKETDGNVH